MFRIQVFRTIAIVLVVMGSAFIHAKAGTCSNTQINQAFTAVILRPPNGSGNSGECNPANYGGSWASMHDLQLRVVAYVNHTPIPKAAPAPVATSAYHFDNSYNVLDSSNRLIARAGTYSLIGQDGAGITPQQAANIVSHDGGTMVPGRSTLGTGSRPVFVVNRR